MFSLCFARLRKKNYYQFSQNCWKGGWEGWCALWGGGAKPSGRGHDNMNAYRANFLQNFLNSRYYIMMMMMMMMIIIIIIKIVHVA